MRAYTAASASAVPCAPSAESKGRVAGRQTIHTAAVAAAASSAVCPTKKRAFALRLAPSAPPTAAVAARPKPTQSASSKKNGGNASPRDSCAEVESSPA